MRRDLLSTQAAKRFFKNLTLLSGVVLLGGLIMKKAQIQGGETMIITGGGSLSVVAFCLGGIFPYRPTDDNVSKHFHLSTRWNMAMSLTGWSLSTLLLGLVFSLLHFPGRRGLLLIGAACLVVSAVGWVVYWAAKRDYE